MHNREGRDGMQGKHSGRRVTLWKKSDSGTLEEEHIGCALEEEHMGRSLEEGPYPYTTCMCYHHLKEAVIAALLHKSGFASTEEAMQASV